MSRLVAGVLPAWLLFAVSFANAQAVRYETPLPSPEEAQASLHQYRELLRTHPDTRAAVPCQVAPHAPHSMCVDIGEDRDDLVVTSPPTLAQVASGWTNDNAYFLMGMRLTYGLAWLPEDVVLQREDIPEQLQRMAERPYGCNPDAMCLSVEQAFDPRLPYQLAYALCERTLGSKLGPPRYCIPMATRISGRWWYLAWQGRRVAGGRGRTDFKYFVGSKNGEAGKFRRNLMSVLAAPPWSLRDEGRGDVFLGAADRRSSRLVPPLREDLAIRIDFNSFDNDTRNRVSFEVTTTIYVNALNTSASEDWHLPKPEVEQRYLAALREAIQKAVLMNCPAPLWRNSGHVECNGTGESSPDAAPNPVEVPAGLVHEVLGTPSDETESLGSKNNR